MTEEGGELFRTIGRKLRERPGGTGIAMIAAMDRNRVIGMNNTIPWRLPAEQQYFKQVTMGHTVVSGRLNYEDMKRPLPGRRNVILTRDKDYAAPGCEIAVSAVDVLERYAGDENSPLFIIGGEQIYRLFMPVADMLYVTVIDAEFEGDAYFPEFHASEWTEVSREDVKADEYNSFGYTYFVYKRRTSG